MNDFYSKLSKILSYCGKDSEAVTKLLTEQCADFSSLAVMDSSLISSLSSDKYAAFIKLISSIASRIGTESFKFGREHTEEEIKAFLCAYYLNAANETLLILPIDKSGRVICAEKVVEGTVNFSSVLPRKLLEIMLKHSSDRAIIAHNHPGGKAEPSEEDIETTRVIKELFVSTSRELICHYVVAGADAFKLTVD